MDNEEMLEARIIELEDELWERDNRIKELLRQRHEDMAYIEKLDPGYFDRLERKSSFDRLLKERYGNDPEATTQTSAELQA